MQSNRERLLLYFPITTSEVINEKSAIKYIKTKIKNAREKKQYVFVIEHLENKELVGYIIVKNMDWDNKECELAYWLGDGFEGQGIMSYSIKQIVVFCFQYLKLHRIILRIAPSNFKSRKLAERNGFTVCRTAEKEYKRGDDIWVDVEYWRINSDGFHKFIGNQ